MMCAELPFASEGFYVLRLIGTAGVGSMTGISISSGLDHLLYATISISLSAFMLLPHLVVLSSIFLSCLYLCEPQHAHIVPITMTMMKEDDDPIIVDLRWCWEIIFK